MNSPRQIKRRDWKRVRNREKNGSKRESNKGRKLEEGIKEGKEEKRDTGSKEDKAPNSDVKFQRKNSENSWKTKKGKRTKKLPAPSNLGKTDRKKQRKFLSISSNVNKSYNERAVAKASSPAAIKGNKKKKPQHERTGEYR